MLTLSISTVNEAFAYEDAPAEVARILRAAADNIEVCGVLAEADTLPLRDINGNMVGTVRANND